MQIYMLHGIYGGFLLVVVGLGWRCALVGLMINRGGGGGGVEEVSIELCPEDVCVLGEGIMMSNVK